MIRQTDHFDENVPKQISFRGKIIKSQDVLRAMERFDREKRASFRYKPETPVYVIQHNDEIYPVKETMRLVLGGSKAGGNFNSLHACLRDLGFVVVTLSEEMSLAAPQRQVKVIIATTAELFERVSQLGLVPDAGDPIRIPVGDETPSCCIFPDPNRQLLWPVAVSADRRGIRVYYYDDTVDMFRVSSVLTGEFSDEALYQSILHASGRLNDPAERRHIL